MVTVQLSNEVKKFVRNEIDGFYALMGNLSTENADVMQSFGCLKYSEKGENIVKLFLSGEALFFISSPIF